MSTNRKRKTERRNGKTLRLSMNDTVQNLEIEYNSQGETKEEKVKQTFRSYFFYQPCTCSKGLDSSLVFPPNPFCPTARRNSPEVHFCIRES